MGFFRKVGKKAGQIKKVGNKIVHKMALGAKKGGGNVKKAGEVVSTLGAVLGQPEIVALGGSMYGTGQAIRKGGKTIEKIRKGEY